MSAKEAKDAPWLSISEFARRYGVDRGTIHEWMNRNLLEIYRMKMVVRVRNVPPDQHKPTAVGGRKLGK